MKKLCAVCLCFLFLFLFCPPIADIQIKGAQNDTYTILNASYGDTTTLSKTAQLKTTQNGTIFIGAFGTIYGSQFASLDGTEPIASLIDKEILDVICLSKTDMLHGLTQLTTLVKQSEVPIVATNLKSANRQFSENAVIIEKNGKKVAVLSLIGCNAKGALPKKALETFTFEDEEKALENTLQELEKTDEVIVFLQDVDPETLQQIQAQFQNQVDIFVTNTPQNTTAIEGSLVSLCEQDNLVALRGDIKTRPSLHIYNTENIATNPTVNTRIKTLSNQQGALKDSVIATTYRDFYADATTLYTHTCDLGYLITDAIQNQSGVTTVLYPSSNIKNGLASGEVRGGDVLRIVDENEKIVGVVLTGSELKTIVNTTLAHENTPYDSYVHFAGLNGVYEKDTEPLVIDTLLIQNKEVRDNKDYLVAMPESALALPAYSFLQDKPIQAVYGNTSVMLYTYVKENGIPVSQPRFSDDQSQTGEQISTNALSWPLYVALPLIFALLYLFNKHDPKMKERFEEADAQALLEKEKEEQERKERLQAKQKKKEKQSSDTDSHQE